MPQLIPPPVAPAPLAPQDAAADAATAGAVLDVLEHDANAPACIGGDTALLSVGAAWRFASEAEADG